MHFSVNYVSQKINQDTMIFRKRNPISPTRFFHFSEFKQLAAFDIHITKQSKLPIIRYYDRNNIH